MSLAVWTPRLLAVALMMNVEDPFRLAAAFVLFAVQFPVQRAILEWEAQARLAPARAAARSGAAGRL